MNEEVWVESSPLRLMHGSRSTLEPSLLWFAVSVGSSLAVWTVVGQAVCICTGRTKAFYTLPNTPYVAFRTQRLLICCFVGFKPTMILASFKENWGAVEGDIRSNRKGNVEIYLLCSHMYYNNNYNYNRNKNKQLFAKCSTYIHESS